MKTIKPKVGRPKLPSIKSLEKKLDKIHSEYIRLRDGKCVICGSTEQLTNGHLFTRGHKSTRWDDLNCHGQCWPENFKHEFDPHPYTSWFIRTYGIEVYDELHRKHTTIRKWTRLDLEDMISIYSAKVQQLS